MEIPREIKDAINKNNLVIFAGAGLSKRFGLPSWVDLVKDIINESENTNLTPFVTLLESNVMTPIEVLEKIKDEHTRIKRYIKAKFHISENSSLSLHKNILKLSGNILTTNYDNAFELASDNEIIPTVYTSPFNISEINKTECKYIFKIHGSYSESDKCILFQNQYDDLYNHKNTSAKEKLKSIFIEKTILFIGFSFNDPDINLIFNNLDEIFENNNTHYILTTESNKFDKLKFLKEIKISQHSDIDNFIELCVDYKNQNKTFTSYEKSKDNERDQTYSPKIAFLSPNPIDIELNSDFIKTIDCFDSLSSNIHKGALNTKTLERIEDYDLIIITSKSYKSNLYIEDQNLKSNLLSPQEICSYIPNDEIPILFITNEPIDITFRQDIANIASYKSSTIKRFVFKTLREGQINFIEPEIKTNFKNLERILFKKGESNIASIYGNNKDLDIGKKSLTDIIGRIEEQAALALKLIGITQTNKLLNIKASGGTGKTTIIKKVAYELYNRGYFKKGVTFKSCENVKSYQDFEEILTQGFNLLNILDFKEYLQTNYSVNKNDLLIILDNFETVVNTLPSSSLDEVINMLYFASDYANIVVTSREKITDSKEFEDVFSLTPLITEDAEKLFISHYGTIQSSDEIRILRQDILEDMLNNNPLAIKLVTKSRTRLRHISELFEQLKENFFESVNEDYTSVFKNNSDLNIERTKSIFQSINYSYTTLNSKEKIAFELLSLFPDGISLINFKKCFEKSRSSNNISDKELRSLKNKSLVEDYNGTLQLQPIIRRFADYQFNKRAEEVKKKYTTDAYSFNCFILEIIEYIKHTKTKSVSLKIYNDHKNNLIKVLSYIPILEISKKGAIPSKLYLLNYLNDLCSYVSGKKQLVELYDELSKIQSYFTDLPKAEISIEVIREYLRYFNEEFDYSYERLSTILPPLEMENRIIKNELSNEKTHNNKIADIHSMEGHTLQFINSYIKNNDFSIFFSNDFYYLGIPNDFTSIHEGFYYFEQELMFNRLDQKKLETYLSSLHSDEHLEIMQTTYTLSKVKKITQEEIQKLVVTNPYTKGLKLLMEASNTLEHDKKLSLFKRALKNLKHIKYYYLEALYYYCIFLKDNNLNKFSKKLDLGLSLAQKYKYQYQEYLFTKLKDQKEYDYTFYYEYYDNPELLNYINTYNKKWSKVIKDRKYLIK